MAKMPVVKTAVARTQDTAEAACHDDIRGDDNEELWAEVRQRYPDRSYKLSEIAELVGLSTISLSLEAKRRGWPMRTEPKAKTSKTKTSKTKTSKPGAASSQLPAKEKPKKAPKESDLLGHVRSTIEGELTKLDKQTGDTSQDRERASRALSQMVNSLEKAIDMQREIAKDTTKGAAKKNKEELAHAEDLRRAIAERIEGLQRKRAPDAGSASADSE
jgi:hypothetical protein